MKKQWVMWVFVIGVVGVVLFALNYQGANEMISLRDLFPEEGIEDAGEIEYEYVYETDGITEIAASDPVPLPKPQVVTREVAAQVSPEVKTGTLDLAAVPFTIQVASSKNKDRAAEALKKVKAAGYPAHLVSRDLGEKGVWHRIYIGNFKTKPEAQEFLSKVRNDYESSFIITPHK